MKTIINRYSFTAAYIAFTALLIFLLTLSCVNGCNKKKADGKMKVAATIVPLADFCRNVGGNLVEVETMVPPGASPHTFEPASEQMMFLSDASVFVENGLDLEEWVSEIAGKVDNDDLIKVTASDRIPKSELLSVKEEQEQEGIEDEDHSGGIYDPHVWLDPELAAREVEAIRDGFIKADPDNKETYKKNAEDYINKLKALKKDISGETSAFTKKKFVSFHPAFSYYAERYGLEQVGVIEELPGKEPNAGEIESLIKRIKDEGVQVIFTEPQFSPKAAETIASESGADVVLKSLDPLGDPDNPETSTYIKLMKHNTSVMSEAMK